MDTIEPKLLKSLMNNSFQLFKLTPNDANIDKLINFLQAYKDNERSERHGSTK